MKFLGLGLLNPFDWSLQGTAYSDFKTRLPIFSLNPISVVYKVELCPACASVVLSAGNAVEWKGNKVPKPLTLL